MLIETLEDLIHSKKQEMKYRQSEIDRLNGEMTRLFTEVGQLERDVEWVKGKRNEENKTATDYLTRKDFR